MWWENGCRIILGARTGQGKNPFLSFLSCSPKRPSFPLTCNWSILLSFVCVHLLFPPKTSYCSFFLLLFFLFFLVRERRGWAGPLFFRNNTSSISSSFPPGKRKRGKNVLLGKMDGGNIRLLVQQETARKKNKLISTSFSNRPPGGPDDPGQPPQVRPLLFLRPLPAPPDDADGQLAQADRGRGQQGLRVSAEVARGRDRGRDRGGHLREQQLRRGREQREGHGADEVRRKNQLLPSGPRAVYVVVVVLGVVVGGGGGEQFAFSLLLHVYLTLAL